MPLAATGAKLPMGTPQAGCLGGRSIGCMGVFCEGQLCCDWVVTGCVRANSLMRRRQVQDLYQYILAVVAGDMCVVDDVCV